MVQIALFLAAIICFFLGTIVLLNNPKAVLFRIYFSLSVVSSLWMVVNGIVINNPLTVEAEQLVFFSRLITPLSLFTTLNFLLFIVVFRRVKLVKHSWLLTIPTLAVSALSFTDWNAYLTASGTTATGVLYPVYLLALLFNVGVVFAALYVRPHRASALLSAQQAAQLKYIKRGTYLTFVPAVFVGAILPLFSMTSVNNIGPLFSIAFLVSAALAIVRHRLFDIRLVVARSLAYVLSLGALSGVFVVATYIVTYVYAPAGGANGNGLRVVYSVLAIVLALVLPKIKSFFDRNTNRLFYRDAYDSQNFLDSFNKILVSTYDLNPLLRKSAEIIEENLKPTFCAFGVRETGKTPRKIVGTANHPHFSEEDIAMVRALTPRMRRKIIIVDSLDPKHAELQRVLQVNNVAILARLTPTHQSEEGSGYLLLGGKKSGNMYSAQDIKIIEILANELVIAIQNALRFEEIENFNLTLQAKVTEATRKLRRSNEKLKALDEAKDDFVSMASHQLRTPLTSVKGYISMVIEGDAGKINATQKQLLEQAFTSSQRMVYLIADLLNVSRLKTGKFIIEPVPVNIAEVVQQEIGQLKDTAAGRQLALTYDMPETFPALMLDETKTRQVIMNFVDNAIYYTPAGGTIEVRLSETPTTVEFRVIDNGIGVPKHEQPHLFTKFYRAGNARTARPDGTGLGLYMAKKVIVAEGGAIIFETAEGKGSTFGFVFSKSKAAPTETSA